MGAQCPSPDSEAVQRLERAYELEMRDDLPKALQECDAALALAPDWGEAHNLRGIILETMGTGFEQPTPPEHLVPYYQFLEQEQGFSSTWIQTDLLFESVEQAKEQVTFFFGEDMIHKVIPGPDENHVLLPECTGIWWMTIP